MKNEVHINWDDILKGIVILIVWGAIMMICDFLSPTRW